MALNDSIVVSCSKIIKFKGKEILVIDPLGENPLTLRIISSSGMYVAQ